MKARIPWLDVARGFAFLTVIYNHLDYSDEVVMKYFYPIELSTFFFVSGYLFKREAPFGQVLEQRTRTLLLPFLVLGGIMIALGRVFSFHERLPLWVEIKGLLLQNGENQLLWFIAALYVYSLVFYWVAHWCKNTRTLMLVGLALFVLNAIYTYWGDGPSLPWHVTSAGFGCFYMACGYCYRQVERRVDAWNNVFLLGGMLFVYLFLITYLNLHGGFYGSKWMLDSIGISLLGLYILIYLSKMIGTNSRFLSFVGANTLFYFAFHGKVYSLLQTVAERILEHYAYVPEWGGRLAIACTIVLADALILILPTMLVNKFAPFLLGKGFKLWKPSESKVSRTDIFDK